MQVQCAAKPDHLKQSGTSVASNGDQGQSGTIQSLGGGFNYSSPLGKRAEIATSYLYSNNTRQGGQTISRQSGQSNALQKDTMPSNRLILSEIVNSSSNQLVNHNLSTRLNWRIDSMNSVQIAPSLMVNLSTLSTHVSTTTYSEQQRLLNLSQLENTLVGATISATNNFLWLHKFSKPQQTFSLNFTTKFNRFFDQGTNQSHSQYYDQLSVWDSLKTVTFVQKSTQHTQSTGNELILSYTNSVSTSQTLELHYTLTSNLSVSNRIVVDINEKIDGSNQLNARLSSQYQANYITNRMGPTWQVRKPTYNYTAGIDFQQASLRSIDLLGQQNLSRQYLNVLPTFLFQPILPPNHYLQLQYQTTVSAPSIFQLQPVANESNPLFIQKGNPLVQPEFSHQLSFNYNSFQTSNFQTFFALLTVSLTNNRITTSTTVNPTGVQIIRPVNTDGYLTTSGRISLGRAINKGLIKGTMNWTGNISINRGLSYVNDQLNRALAMSVGQALTFNITTQSEFEMGLSGRINYQAAEYSFQTRTKNQSLNLALSSQFYWPLPFGFKLATDLSYISTKGRSAGYNQRYCLWNGYVSRTFLNKQQGELRLQAYDLLNQNRSLVRTVTDTYIEDIQSQVLKRYIMLNFIYNFRQFNKQ